MLLWQTTSSIGPPHPHRLPREGTICQGRGGGPGGASAAIETTHRTGSTISAHPSTDSLPSIPTSELGSCWSCGGGTETSASGVGKMALSCTRRPQPEQNRLSGPNSCPQLPQYLSATVTPSPSSCPASMLHEVTEPLASIPLYVVTCSGDHTGGQSRCCRT